MIYAGDEVYGDDITSELDDDERYEFERWMDEADDRRKAEQERIPEPYCDYCENDGHTFRSCPMRDDDPESF